MITVRPLILIVDDLAANRETLVELLAARDYEVIEAADGPSALQLAAARPPDLVLLDVMMPGMDGYEVCRRLRASVLLAEVPIIMITALDDEHSRLAGLEAGADDFLSKPFNRAELRARVGTITRLNRYRRLLEAQASLLAHEARLQLLAEHSAEVFWFTTLRPERVSYVSPAVEKIWQMPVAAFLGDARTWERGIHPDDQPRVHAAFEAMVTGCSPRFVEEYRVVRPDQSIRWVLDSGTPLRDETGLLVSVGGVAHDVTDAKAAEEKMLRAQRLENIGMLAAGIAHDFNNALAPLVMGCSLLRRQVINPDGLRLVDIMESSAIRSVALVRQLLSFARGAAGGRQLLQARLLLRELGDLAGVTFPKAIQIQLVLPRDLWLVHGNATQLHQVFLNLCVNARDAMPQGGILTITAENRILDTVTAAEIPDARPGSFLAVEVRDTGTGIASEVLGRIWEPFYTTKGEGQGTGLGLATVRGILHQHDGFVTVHTRLGRGTAFKVYLPASTGAIAIPAQTAGATQIQGQGELILIVDDEEPVRAITAQVLHDHGYQTLTAGDGADALALFAPRMTEVRLVLCDVQMPLLGGAELAAVLRRMQPGLPIVSMSGLAQGSSPPYPGTAGAFLAKPFQPATLLSLVQRTLAAARSLTPSPVGATGQ